MKETNLSLDVLIKKAKEMLAAKRSIENGSSYEEELAKIKSKEQN